MNYKLKSLLIKLAQELSVKPGVKYPRKTEAGFSLIEVFTVVIIVGILSAIVAPAWDAFVNRQRFRAAQNTVFQAMQSAQAAARGTRTSWQVTFKEDTDNNGNNRVYVALHSVNIVPDDLSEVGEASGITENAWYPLAEGIQIDDNSQNLVRVTDDNNPEAVENYDEGNIYRILFNYSGCPVYEDGDECTQSDRLDIDENNPIILTLKHKPLGENAQRCVFVQTLIGSMRTAEGNAEDDNSLCQ